MNTPLALIRRVEDLERTIANQAALIGSLLGRGPRSDSPRTVRLAVTVADAADTPTYPESGCQFKCTFVDREFTRAVGICSGTTHARSNSWDVIAQNITGDYLPEGTLVQIFFCPPPPGTTDKGRWFIERVIVSVGVPFRNDSGETAPARGVMRVIDSEDIDGVEHVIIEKPGTTFLSQYLVNLGEDVADEETGLGTWLCDADWVLYDSADTAPALGDEWGPQDGSWALKKFRYGFDIVDDTPTGSSAYLVRARQFAVKQFWGQTYGSITKGSTGTVEVYDGNDADTGLTVSGVKNKGVTAGDNKKVGVSIYGGKCYLDWIECPVA